MTVGACLLSPRNLPHKFPACYSVRRTLTLKNLLSLRLALQGCFFAKMPSFHALTLFLREWHGKTAFLARFFEKWHENGFFLAQSLFCVPKYAIFGTTPCQISPILARSEIFEKILHNRFVFFLFFTSRRRFTCRWLKQLRQ